MKKMIYVFLATFMVNSYGQNISSSYSNEKEFFASMLLKISTFFAISIFDAMIILSLIIVLISIAVGFIFNKMLGKPLGEGLSSGLAAFLVYLATDLMSFAIIAAIVVLAAVIFISKERK